jgi:hypothetical protein
MAARALCFLALGIVLAARVCLAQTERLEQIDLIHPELASPEQDVASAIKRRDFRFLAIDREQRNIPGMEQHRRLVMRVGVKFVKQPLWLFPKPSQQFSFNLRAIAYAKSYNLTLAQYLTTHARSLGLQRSNSR